MLLYITIQHLHLRKATSGQTDLRTYLQRHPSPHSHSLCLNSSALLRLLARF